MSEPCRAYRRWFGKATTRVAWLALIVAVVHPPHGLGLPICWLRTTTGLLCPGCGITRSMSCAVRGLFEQSWQYHPFGILLLAFFCLAAAISLLPPRRKVRLARFIQRHGRPASVLHIALITAFIVFGVLRAVVHVLGGQFIAA
ncbi:MAG: DUF2752 domain-containing protein [Phycisphaerales bacterium]|nr:MAG: DUF2752 domain-containing protein [Phycisphaerales bacterium]